MKSQVATQTFVDSSIKPANGLAIVSKRAAHPNRPLSSTREVSLEWEVSMTELRLTS